MFPAHSRVEQVDLRHWRSTDAARAAPMMCTAERSAEKIETSNPENQ